ncbi:MAG: hypothetical protein CMB37_06105, partial [Euryarchaeota archaeon]|nr:hypothetical protein [Euryarchaeota archaeon]
PEPTEGCMDANATNFDSSAEIDDGSCAYPEPEPDPVPEENSSSDEGLNIDNSDDTETSGSITDGRLFRIIFLIIALSVCVLIVTIFNRTKD